MRRISPEQRRRRTFLNIIQCNKIQIMLVIDETKEKKSEIVSHKHTHTDNYNLKIVRIIIKILEKRNIKVSMDHYY